jgi:hypothetical protein
MQYKTLKQLIFLLPIDRSTQAALAENDICNPLRW